MMSIFSKHFLLFMFLQLFLVVSLYNTFMRKSYRKCFEHICFSKRYLNYFKSSVFKNDRDTDGL